MDPALGPPIGSKAYMGTGYNGVSYFNDFWEYDPHQRLDLKASFGGVARSNAVGFAIEGKGYIGTGFDGTDRQDFHDLVWINQQPERLLGPCGKTPVGFAINNRGYIGTGDVTAGGAIFLNQAPLRIPD